MKTLGKIAIYQGTEYEFRKKTDGICIILG